MSLKVCNRDRKRTLMACIPFLFLCDYFPFHRIKWSNSIPFLNRHELIEMIKVNGIVTNQACR